MSTMTLEDFLGEWNNGSDKLLVHTSGSTGHPKPMWVEKAKMLNSARITCDFLGLRAGDTALLCMPLDYIAGKMVVVRAIERHLRLINEKPSGHPLATPFKELKDGEPLTFAAMVPLQVYNTLMIPEECQRLRTIRHLIIGGGAVDKKMSEALRDFPNNIWSSYAMTETLSHIALRRVNGPDANDWYTPFDTVDISQAADGCLVINAPLVHDGILKTNDIVEIRETAVKGKIQKQFHVVGRKDNVINSGGIKIQIEEVESALKPFLKAPFAITKAPDEKFGEEVVLVTEADDLSEIQEICVNALPRYWQPRRYLHVDSIPMTETGKPARQQIEQIARS